MPTMIRWCTLALLVALSAGCGRGSDGGVDTEAEISLDQFREYLKTLSSDEFEGRAPGTPGGEKAANYIAEQFQAVGLRPGNGDSYFQNALLVGMIPDPSIEMNLHTPKGTRKLTYRDDFVAWAGVEEEEVSLDQAPLVFVGYGIKAPEVPWDDFKGGDFNGKVLLALVNDPPSDNPSFFGGKALTYYGRWTYKLEEAARQGATGMILIHDTDMAGYPWSVVSSSWTGEQFSLPSEGEKSSVVEAWVQREQGDQILQTAGLSFEEAREKASQSDFQPIELPVKISLTLHSTIRRIESPNVVGMLPGNDPRLKEQAVIVTSHYDHFGKGTAPADDPDADVIYNGAFDNASGTAALIEIARTMAASSPPRRSILFAAVTAEEQGLLGSEYYAGHPLIPLGKTAANVNVDGLNLWGRAKDIVPMGAERSSIQQTVEEIGAEMGLTLSPDPSPEKGYYFRSDHFSLVKKGVPAVYIDMGLQFEGKPDDWGRQLMDDYTAQKYHQPSDEYDPSWSLEGSVQAMQFIRKTIRSLADQDEMPTWKPGDPFEETRKKSLGQP